MSATVESLPNLDVVLDVAVDVSIELGSCRMPMREVLRLAPGGVVTLDKTTEAPVDVFVNGKPFARGEVLVVEGRVSVKITELVKA